VLDVRRSVLGTAAGFAAAALGLAGCAGHAAVKQSGLTDPLAATTNRTPTAQAAPSMVKVAPLRHRVRADVLVTATKSLPKKTVRRLDHLHIVAAATTIDVGRIKVNGHRVHAVAADPSRFRDFAPKGTAEVTPVWQTLASGSLVVAHATAHRLGLQLGSLVTVHPGGVFGKTLSLRVGAFATTIPGADVLVSPRLARQLGMHHGTGIVLSAGRSDPTALASAVRSVVGSRAKISLLTPPTANPTAFLTGGAAASAFGAFSYRYFKDGTIEPDAAWVARSIVTESVPILGAVTCHRLMFPQLRGALQEVVAKGLAHEILPSEYGGCYVPRFIERNPSRSISLHTWGIAIDLNVAQNPVHTRGHMDPRIVAIFKSWGFRWGGDWSDPDPMHFELGALLNR
jgi:D-alanyl-D-alanine carboxypeptidase-like protein